VAGWLMLFNDTFESCICKRLLGNAQRHKKLFLKHLARVRRSAMF
jgi:hypothetical protein